jgi:hypothetical protein
MLEILEELLDLLEPLVVAAVLVPVELLVQWLQAVLRALERVVGTAAWSALTSRS